MESELVKDRWLLVTGGARRLGAECVRWAWSKGYQVLIHYHTSKEAAEALAAENPQQSLLLPLNLDQQDSGRRLARLAVEAIETQQGTDLSPRISFGLIHAASRWDKNTWAQCAERDWLRDQRIGPLAFLGLMQTFVQTFASGWACALTDARWASYDLQSFSYLSSKRALQQLCHELALTAAPAWRVNSVAPGALLAPEGTADSLAWRKAQESAPLNQGGRSIDLASALSFLHDQEVTGQILYLDGGRHLKGGPHGGA